MYTPLSHKKPNALTKRAYDGFTYQQFLIRVKHAVNYGHGQSPSVIEDRCLDEYLRTLWSENYLPDEAATKALALLSRPVLV